MRILTYVLFTLILALPYNATAGIPPGTTDAFIDVNNTDITNLAATEQLNAYYDLRERKTYIQITNNDPFSIQPPNVIIHVQIFQHDRNCDELNFFDELTPNDTVIYDMDNIIKNDGSTAPVTLQNNSYGYVVVTAVTLSPQTQDFTRDLVGNFRIIDDAGYEYRTNMQNTGVGSFSPSFQNSTDWIANFNNIDGANLADVVGFGYRNRFCDYPELAPCGTVANLDEGIDFDIFIFDLNEEPLSCDRKNFACGNVMNYGINDDYVSSKGNEVLCEGGGLADPNGGFISFENATHNFPGGLLGRPFSTGDIFSGYIGINNGDGTGSMDSWIMNLNGRSPG